MYGLKLFSKIMYRFSVKKQQPLWIITCFRPIELVFVSVGLWKLDICIVFLPIFMLFPFSRFGFVRNYFIFELFDNAKAFVVLATNINHQSTVRLQQKIKQPYVVSHETKHKKTLHACSTVKTIQIYNTLHLLHGTA